MRLKIMDEIPVGDEEVIEILMHREIHFGGKFSVMIPYYLKGGRGALHHIEMQKIEELAQLEIELGQDLAPLLLSGRDAEKIANAKAQYEKLKEVYEKERVGLERLITDLILTEEADPQSEREAICIHKNKLVPSLIDMLRSEELHDPLFPGYGLAPVEAAKCLGQIGDKRAVFTLFEEIGRGDFDRDEIILKAFKAMGDEGKKFLLSVIASKPIAEDNDRAAIALAPFQHDKDVIDKTFELLNDPEVQNSSPFCNYLALLLGDLQDANSKERFKTIAKTAPKDLQQEMMAIIKEWD
jgi:hypothetical protein